MNRISSGFEDQIKKNSTAFAQTFSGAKATKIHSTGVTSQSNREEEETKSFHVCFSV